MALVISGNLALGTTASELSLKHPRIGYENRCRDANCTITTSTAQANLGGDSVISGLTYDFWKPTTTPATITFAFTEAITADYCGIAAHTLTQTSNSVELEYWDAAASPAAWVSLGSVLPGNSNGNPTIMFLFDEISSQTWRLTLTGAGEIPTIGVVNLGAALKVERRIYGGHTPITLSKNTVIRPNKSENGQFLGRSIIREGATTGISLKNLTPAWVRASFYPFMDSARTYPFFWAWRPQLYADEVAYVWVNKDIVVSNSGQADLMDTSFTVEGFIE